MPPPPTSDPCGLSKIALVCGPSGQQVVLRAFLELRPQALSSVYAGYLRFNWHPRLRLLELAHDSVFSDTELGTSLRALHASTMFLAARVVVTLRTASFSRADKLAAALTPLPAQPFLARVIPEGAERGTLLRAAALLDLLAIPHSIHEVLRSPLT